MEKTTKAMNGYMALFLSLVTLGLAIYFFLSVEQEPASLSIAMPCLLATIFVWKGLMIVQPNHARVLNLFGKYVGSVKDNGLFFVNPFYVPVKLSLRAQN